MTGLSSKQIQDMPPHDFIRMKPAADFDCNIVYNRQINSVLLVRQELKEESVQIYQRQQDQTVFLRGLLFSL